MTSLPGLVVSGVSGAIVTGGGGVLDLAGFVVGAGVRLRLFVPPLPALAGVVVVVGVVAVVVGALIE